MSDEELIHAGHNIDTNYRSQIKSLRVAENEYQYYERSKETMKKLIKLHQKTGGTVLLVAHAPSLEVLTRHLMQGLPRPERLSELAGKVDYCSMTIVEGDPSTKNWQFRYALDPQVNWQQHQSNHLLNRSQTEGILSSTSHGASSYQFLPQQDAYPPHFVF